MSKKFFLSLRDYYAEKEPFSETEEKNYSFQDRNFIRGIQITKSLNKSNAIKKFLGIKKKSRAMRGMSIAIQALYDRPDRFEGPLPPIPPTPPIPKKQVYKYKGVTKLAKKSDLNRFFKLGGSAMRYIDTKTGEEISRREKDKRLFILVSNYDKIN